MENIIRFRKPISKSCKIDPKYKHLMDEFSQSLSPSYNRTNVILVLTQLYEVCIEDSALVSKMDSSLLISNITMEHILKYQQKIEYRVKTNEISKSYGTSILFYVSKFCKFISNKSIVKIFYKPINFLKRESKIKEANLNPLLLGSERTISLDKNTMVHFKNLIETREKDLKNVHKLVFYDCLSDISIIKNDRLNDVLRAILKRLNITPLITAHGLRHTHASILLYQGISILYVSERLGHASIDITSFTYAHVLKELRNRDSQKTNKIFENLMH